MRSRVIAPVLFTTAVLATAVVWTWALRAHRSRERRPPVPVRADAVDVPGLAGEVAVSGGVRLGVRIARLHQESERQHFDAQALRDRFGLGEGEPFQCLLTLRGALDGSAPSPEIALADAHVEDERGQALRVFRAPVGGSAAAPADPLATLMSPPAESLRVERSVSILMWGREPAAHARLVVVGAPDVEVSAARLSTRDLDNALARIDAQTVRADAASVEGDRR